MLSWGKVFLAGTAAPLLLAGAAGCASAAPSAPGAPAAATTPGTTAAPASSPAGAVPQQWRLVSASGQLHDITIAVPACTHIARITVAEPAGRAVITVYGSPVPSAAGTPAPGCSWQRTTERTVSLAQPISCQRLVVDGATSRPPQLASNADVLSVTFACPLNP